jgi:hypothetical protein
MPYPYTSRSARSNSKEFRSQGCKRKVVLVRQSSRALHVVTPGLRQFSEHHGRRRHKDCPREATPLR